MLKKAIDHWWDLVTGYPRAVIAVTMLLTAAFGYFAVIDFRLDNTIDKLMTTGDPDWDYLKIVRRSFGSDDIITVGIECTEDGRGVYRPDVLAVEREMSDRMARLELKSSGAPFSPLHSVTGLSDSSTIVGTELGMRVVDVMDNPPADQAGAELVRERALNDVILVDNNVNRRGTVVGIDFFMKPEDDAGNPVFSQDAAREVERNIAELSPRIPARFHVNGESVFNLESTRYTSKDLTVRTFFVLLLVLGTLAVAFRSLAGVLLPVLTPLGAVIWTIGFIHLTGSYMTVTTGIVPVLIIAIGTASTMHVVAHHGLEGGSTPVEFVKLAMHKVGGAVFLAGLTTAVGFASLMTNKIVNVREMGLYSAFGITVDFLLSMSLVPALLCFRKSPVSRLRAPGSSVPLLERVLLATSRFATTRSWLVVFASLAVTAVSVWGATRLHVETNYLEMLKKTDPMRVADDFLEANLTGQKVFNVYLEADAGYLRKNFPGEEFPKPFLDPEQLRRIDALHQYLAPTVCCPACGELVNAGIVPPGEELPCSRCRAPLVAPPGERSTWSAHVKKVVSFVDFVKQMNRASNFSDPLQFSIPDDRRTIARYVLDHGEPKEMLPYITEDRSLTRIFIRTDVVSSNDTAEFNDDLRAFCERNFAGVAVPRACSTGTCLAAGQNAISLGQVKSLGSTLACISIILFLAFKSLKVGLLALPSNLLPVATLFGLMGAMGTNLDVGTSIVGCMGIGIAVDDTVHFLSRYLKELQIDGNVDEAIRRTTLTTGRPIVFTSVALALGFILLLSSDFVPVIYLGLYTAVTMVVALLGDLLLLPALLSIFKPRSGRTLG